MLKCWIKYLKKKVIKIIEILEMCLLFRDHPSDQHRIAAFCPAKKISMRYNAPLIQWRKKVFKRTQGKSLFKLNIFFPNFFFGQIKICMRRVKLLVELRNLKKN